MQTERPKYEFDPQDIDAILDQIAERRGIERRGHYRSLVTGEQFLIGVNKDGALVSVPVAG
jgi:hypothetical protein